MVITDLGQQHGSVEVEKADSFDSKLDFIRSLASPIRSPQRRKGGTLYNLPPSSPSPFPNCVGTTFRCSKSSSPNSDKMCDGVATLSTASSDGISTSTRHVSGCNTPMLSGACFEVEERGEPQGSSLSGCNNPIWSGPCSEVEEDMETCVPNVNHPPMKEFVHSSPLKQRKKRCARVVSALARHSHGYKSLRSAFEAMDKDGDGRLDRRAHDSLRHRWSVRDDDTAFFRNSSEYLRRLY
jgi:hypothetical protein